MLSMVGLWPRVAGALRARSTGQLMLAGALGYEGSP
jgi:hypothetical protein